VGLLTPVLGWLIHKIHNSGETNRLDWTKLAFWSLFTHILLDCFTSYGTQIFLPFSDYRVALNTIFVIDPFYTVPFLLCVIILMFFGRTTKTRRMLNYIGLGLSSFYLLLTVLVKFYVNNQFVTSAQSQNIQHSRYLTAPTPLKCILWRCVLEDENGFWIGYYSLFDRADKILFEHTPRNEELISSVLQEPVVEKLLWVSNKYYCITQQNQNLYFNDLRFGRMNWTERHSDAEKDGGYVFSYKLMFQTQNSVKIQRARQRPKIDKKLWTLFLNRVKGI